jgi:hypothetical protein
LVSAQRAWYFRKRDSDELTALDGTAYASYGSTTGMTLDTEWQPYIGAAQFEQCPSRRRSPCSASAWRRLA